MLLILVVLISGVLIVKPGPHWGIDIIGGSRIMLKLEAKEATIEFESVPDNFVEAREKVVDVLEGGLHTRVWVLSTDENTDRFTLVIGKAVEENVVNSFLEEEEAKVAEGGFRDADFSRSERMQYIRDEVLHSLELRVDPYGTLGAQFKPLGSEYVLFEVALELPRAKKLLGHQGRLEIFIEDNLVLRGEHIKSVGSVNYGREGVYYVPFELTKKGARLFASASKGKGGYPGVIYLDRPDDTVLLIPEDLALTGGLVYEKEAHKILYAPGDFEHPFYLQVPAVRIKRNLVPPEAENFLKNQRKFKTHAVLLGRKEEFSENVIVEDNLIVSGEALYPVESMPRREGEASLSWIADRVCGAKSWPIISPEIAGDIEAARTGLMITTGKDRREAEDLQVILSQRLPVQVSYASEANLSPRLGRKFLQEALKAGAAALVAVGALVFFRYRRLKIALPLILTMLCEVLITLGFSSMIPQDLMTIGLPEIGGLIAVVGTGVDHQIIITDEFTRGKSSRGRIPLERRTSRAFSIIFAAAATTIVAMFALALLGFGAMRGFAIITTIGVLISVLITRPAYARIIGILLAGE